MNRFGAFAVHLGISLIIFFILGYLILFQWYPDFFFASDGGWQGIRIVALVDLVLGPMLTLVVFNRAKPRTELKRDLSIIGFIQLGCLAAGVYVVYSERPIAMVFADGYFHSLSRDDYLEVGLRVPDLSGFGEDHPVWVSVRLPTDPGEQYNIRNNAMKHQLPIRVLWDYYQPFRLEHIDLDHDGYHPESIRDPDLLSYLREFAKSQNSILDHWTFVPFGTRYRTAVIAVRKAGGSLLYLAPPGTEER